MKLKANVNVNANVTRISMRQTDKQTRTHSDTLTVTSAPNPCSRARAERIPVSLRALTKQEVEVPVPLLRRATGRSILPSQGQRLFSILPPSPKQLFFFSFPFFPLSVSIVFSLPPSTILFGMLFLF